MGSLVIPKQIIVIALKGSGTPLQLPYETSILVYADPAKLPIERVLIRGLQSMSLEYALCKVSPIYFKSSPQEAELAIRSIRDPNALLKIIVQHNFKSAAGRIIGAYRFLAESVIANDLKKALEHIGIRVEENTPFERTVPFLKNNLFS